MFFNIYNRKKKRLESILERCQLYLMPGTYRLSLSEDVAYHSRTSSLLSGLTFSSRNKNGLLKTVAKSLINIFVRQEIQQCNKCVFQGSEVVLTSSRKEYKIFDYINREVVTLLSDIEKQGKIEENKSFFSKYFNVPQTIEYIPNIYYQKEKLIMHVPFNKEDAFVDVLHKYLYYCTSNNFIQNEERYWKERRFVFSERFGDSDLLMELEKFPIIYTHGDLWSSNVIYDGTSFYITDFERGYSRFFGYDLMTFLCSEWIINNDNSLIDKFLSGKWDLPFKKITHLYSLSFDGRMKELLLLAFIVTIFFERWRDTYELDCTIKKFIKLYIPNYIK